ncbi:tetratricopeptide repeat protein [Emticicia sp. 17c]|uniref:tetratricopeptide repeat protein n=1 Tax=Emticicia sp. 17c TaxID=3127704 RepID=UPI00301C547F
MTKKRYNIFLASSEQLAKERDEFEIAIGRYNDELDEKETMLTVVRWESLDPAVHDTPKQDFYYKKLKTCHILVLVYWGELGKFTNKEYQEALALFKARGVPHIYICKKTNPVSFTPKPENVRNLEILEAELAKTGQWPFRFTEVSEFTLNIRDHIGKLFTDKDNLDFVYGSEAPYLNYYETEAKLLSLNGAIEPSLFIGRKNEREQIRTSLTSSGSLVLINAEGGIGKTTLAARYWHDTLHHYQYNAWLFCENGILEALKSLAEELNVNLSGMDETQQLQALKRAFKQVHDNCLLVLDNANNEPDLHWFRREFAGFHWHVLITSRCNGVFPSTQELPIRHLPPALAKDLFKHFYNEPTNPQFEVLLDRLLEAIHYHTLLIEIFAKNLAELRGAGITLAQFLQQLQTGGLYLKAHSFEINTDYTLAPKHGPATTDEILDRLYDFSKLAPEQIKLLLNLAILPAEPYELRFLNELLGQNLPEIDLTLLKTLKELVKKGWLGLVEENYRLSPVIQELLLTKHQHLLKQQTQGLIDRLMFILKDDAYNLINISLKDAAPYIKLIESINKSFKALPDKNIANLNFSAGVYANNTGDIVAESSYWANYHAIYQALNNQEPANLVYKNGLAISYENLGSIYRAKGDLDKALAHYQDEEALFKELCALSPDNLSYKHGLAISYSYLGNIYEAKGNLDKALEHYHEYNRLRTEINAVSPDNLSYKHGLAISYHKLGNIYKSKGDLDKALECYREDLKITNELDKLSPDNLSYKNGLAISYENLGSIYEAKGDLDKALEHYQEYNHLCKEVVKLSPDNLSYKNVLAISFYKLGDVYKQQKNFLEALSCLSESRTLLQTVCKATQGVIVEFVYNFAGISRDLADLMKILLAEHYYPEAEVPDIQASAKAIRREAYAIIAPLAEKGLLQKNQIGLYEELANEDWYGF